MKKKSFIKIALIFLLNFLLFFTALLWLSGVFVTLDNIDSIKENQLKISQIEEQYNNFDFDNLDDNSIDSVISLSENKKDFLNKIVDNIYEIKGNAFTNWNINQLKSYEDYSEYISQYSKVMDNFIVYIRAIKEKQSEKTTNELASQLEEENQKANNLEIKPLEPPTLKQFIKQFNKVHYGFLIMILLTIGIIFSYLKLFEPKSWKIWIIFSINVLLALFLMFSVYYVIVPYTFRYSLIF